MELTDLTDKDFCVDEAEQPSLDSTELGDGQCIFFFKMDLTGLTDKDFYLDEAEQPPLDLSPPSGSEFGPEDEEVKPLNDVELEDNEPDTELVGRKPECGVKKQKKGMAARNNVHTIQDQLSEAQGEDNNNEGGVKRKTTSDK